MIFFEHIVELEKKRLSFALCTVVNFQGSTPRKAGAKMIVVDNNETHGSIIGTIGGGAIEHHIRSEAIKLIRERKSSLITTSLRNELGMCCGGEMSVFVDTIVQKPPLICFGAGHIAQALCPLAEQLGFLVHVVDKRAELLSHRAFATVAARHSDTSIFSLTDLPFFDDSFVVVATHDHDLDQQIIEGIIRLPFRYLALVGSQRKALMTKKRLLAKGFDEQELSRIICPAGLSILATTPQEIAVAIAAEMIKVKNDETTRSLDRSSGNELAHGGAQGAHDLSRANCA